jgi:hypothetical protein
MDASATYTVDTGWGIRRLIEDGLEERWPNASVLLLVEVRNLVEPIQYAYTLGGWEAVLDRCDVALDAAGNDRRYELMRHAWTWVEALALEQLADAQQEVGR